MTTVSTILGPLYLDDQGSVDAPTALLWPSLFTDHHLWDQQVAALRDVGWRTLAVDPPGHGQSPGPQRRFTMDQCAEAAVQMLDASGLRKSVVLLGNSWGGFVAPRVALLAPDRVRSMVLFNTSAERPTAFNRANAMLLVTLFGIGALDGVVNHLITSALLGPQTRRSQPQIEAGLAMQLRTWDRRAVINTVRSVLVDRDAVLDALPGVSVPALIVSGEQDTIFPSVLSRRIAEKMPNARHVQDISRHAKSVGSLPGMISAISLFI